MKQTIFIKNTIVLSLNMIISCATINAQTNTSYRSNSDNLTGNWNTALGVSSLSADKQPPRINNQTLGNANTAIGFGCLNSNIGEWNTAVGVNIMSQGFGGGYNCAMGVNALYANVAYYNTAIGTSSLFSNVGGYFNTATGYNTLYSNSNGNYNTANGVGALFSNQTGMANTAIGYNADVSSSSLNNATSIGSNAKASASNTVVVGDAKITSIGGYSNWVNLSDGRFKKNIKEDIHGLDFIMQLQPVSYNMDVKKLNSFLGVNENKTKMENELKMSKEEIAKMKSIEDKGIAEKEAIRYDGFIAQDVEKVAKSIGYDFSGVIKPANEKDHYKMSYSDFVVPLVKGMQEQENKIQELEKQIDELKKMISSKEDIKISGIELSDKNAIVLNQNVPNPFANQTSISYSVPQNSTAQIIFYDATGRVIKSSNVSGKGQLNVFGNDLMTGTYSYSLFVDGKKIDTKKLVKENK